MVLSRVVRTLKISLIEFKYRIYKVLNVLGKISSSHIFVQICVDHPEICESFQKPQCKRFGNSIFTTKFIYKKLVWLDQRYICNSHLKLFVSTYCRYFRSLQVCFFKSGNSKLLWMKFLSIKNGNSAHFICKLSVSSIVPHSKYNTHS